MNRENQEAVDDEIMEDDEGIQENRFLTFLLGSEEYGLEINFVKEVVGIQKITAIPDMPEYIKGVFNLRGQVIPIMDARARFCLGQKEYNDRTCVIVVDVGDSQLGLIVDEVKDVLEIPEEKIVAPPRIQQSEKNEFVRGLGKHDDCVKIIIDAEALFDH
ncbi:MAG: purine-binding chemotaxis protein CheW [Desulfobacteraceae bacterium]|nr:MAG: purine-binding chemotaxis protein CheW [Desulfobacteraceae bacterium]